MRLATTGFSFCSTIGMFTEREASMSEAQGFAHPEFLAETDWLAAHLNDPSLIVLDGTVHLIPDPKITDTVKSGREDFEKGHIPGAQFIDLQADLSAAHPKLRFMMPDAAAFAAAMGRFGVGDNSRVILYSTTTPQWAARIWWMLRNTSLVSATTALAPSRFDKIVHRALRDLALAKDPAEPVRIADLAEPRTGGRAKSSSRGAGEASSIMLRALLSERRQETHPNCENPERSRWTCLRWC